MPLLTLEINPGLYRSLPPKTMDDTIIGFCNKGLDVALDRLDIPDPNDREYRVVLSRGFSSVNLAFTAGGDEYSTGEIFQPTRIGMILAAADIHVFAEAAGIPLSSVQLESWKNTSFRAYSQDKLPDSVPPPILRRYNNPQLRDYAGLAVTLTLSPKNLHLFDCLSFVDEKAFLNETIRGVAGLVVETMALPSIVRTRLEVVYARYAETGTSVEVDLWSSNPDMILPQEEMDQTAYSIEQLLMQKELLEVNTASVWVRQGKPDSLVLAR
jgi:hypothetical protein